MDLTALQREVVEARENLLVLGGPGAGKTTVGLLKAKARVDEGMSAFQEVLFLSFSNNAVGQIRQAAKLTLSADERRGLSIQTFHSFCWAILRCYGGLIGLPLPLTTLAPEEEAVLRAGLANEEWEQRRRSLAYSTGRVAFDLFAEFAGDVFERCESVRALFASCHPLVIVDEFQDTDDSQWRAVNALTKSAQIIALADSHQRIYDFRPGVRADRLELYTAARSAKVINLGTDNHRSPGGDVLRFAQHILEPALGPFSATSVAIETYEFERQCGVRLKYAIQKAERAVRQARGDGPVSVLILGAANRTVERISAWLSKPTEKAKFSMGHEVWVDSNEFTCACRVLVSVLETGSTSIDEAVVMVLRRIAEFQMCRNIETSIADATQLNGWADTIRSGTWPARAPLPKGLKMALSDLQEVGWSGDVISDVTRASEAMNRVADKRLKQVMELCQLRAPLRHGDSACKALEKLYRQKRAYSSASSLFQRTIAQDRLADRFVGMNGRNVMTLHKCKGKEFDAVIIFDGAQEPHRLVQRDDSDDLQKSRRLLRVGITRARYHVRILTPASDRCPLLPIA